MHYAFELLEGVRRVLLCILEAVQGELLFARGVGGVGGARCAGGDVLCAALYTRGCGGRALFTLGVEGRSCEQSQRISKHASR